MRRVVCLGGRHDGADAAGGLVHDLLARRRLPADLELVDGGLGGLNLLACLENAERVVLVDAIQTRGGKPGTVHRLRLEDLNILKHTASPHDTNLPTVMELARQWKLALPAELAIVAVEIPPDCSTFTEQCSPAMEAAIPRAVDMVMSILAP